MTYPGSTGARWLDTTLIGISVLVFPLIAGVVLLTHSILNLDAGSSAFFFGFGLVGAFIIALGVWLGKRTSWKVPDPKLAKTR